MEKITSSLYTHGYLQSAKQLRTAWWVCEKMGSRMRPYTCKDDSKSHPAQNERSSFLCRLKAAVLGAFKITIRQAKKSDLKEIATLFREESAKKPYNEIWTKKTATKKMRLYFKDGTMFVAVKERKIIGFITGHLFYFWDGWNGYVDELFVSVKHQGKGIGSVLLESLENHFKKKGVIVVSLGANEKSRAYDFYKKHGYKYEKFKILFKRL